MKIAIDIASDMCYTRAMIEYWSVAEMTHIAVQQCAARMAGMQTNMAIATIPPQLADIICARSEIDPMPSLEDTIIISVAYEEYELGYDDAMERLMALGYTEKQADDILISMKPKKA